MKKRIMYISFIGRGKTSGKFIDLSLVCIFETLIFASLDWFIKPVKFFSSKFSLFVSLLFKFFPCSNFLLFSKFFLSILLFCKFFPVTRPFLPIFPFSKFSSLIFPEKIIKKAIVPAKNTP